MPGARKPRQEPFKKPALLQGGFEDLNDAMHYCEIIAPNHFGRGFHKWLKKDKPRTNKSGDWIQKLRCTFFHTAECPQCIRIIKKATSETYDVESGSFPHNDHVEVERSQTRGLTKTEKNKIFSSPSKAAMNLVASARNKMPLSTKQKNKILRSQHHERSKSAVVQPGQAREGGGMLLTCQHYRKKAIVARKMFNEHSVFCLGVKYNPTDGKEVFVAILSSENLLLNAYRQSFWGQPVLIAADTSYRLNQEGNGVYPVCTVTAGQITKTIAYAILSHEHDKIQQYVFGKVKHWVEKDVASRRKRGDRHV